MKVLLHICCAPCCIVPIETLKSEGMDVMGFFYRHNIHPYTECLRRQETLQSYADRNQFADDLPGRLRSGRFYSKCGVSRSRSVFLLLSRPSTHNGPCGEAGQIRLFHVNPALQQIPKTRYDTVHWRIRGSLRWNTVSLQRFPIRMEGRDQNF